MNEKNVNCASINTEESLEHKKNYIKYIKSLIPWRVRYFIKLQEAKGNIKLPNCIKQQRSIAEYNNTFYNALRDLEILNFRNKAVCELGPGQRLTHPFLEYQMGATEEVLLEIADIAGVNRPLDKKGLQLDYRYERICSLPDIVLGETWKSYLKKVNAKYKVNGIEGYKEVADCSIDYVFSFAVFEHIRKRYFEDTLKEIYRFMRQGGVSYHTVDFTDHMGGGKNQLRFSETVWEDEDHYNMDNYTNRIPCSQMCRLIEEAGFEIIKLKKERLIKPPLSKTHIDKNLRDMSDDDLMTAKAVIIARKC